MTNPLAYGLVSLACKFPRFPIQALNKILRKLNSFDENLRPAKPREWALGKKPGDHGAKPGQDCLLVAYFSVNRRLMRRARPGK